MAEATDNAPQQASNMWFTEYDMPFTTLILENEAAYAAEHPEATKGERHELAQFIIDQETAVARDFAEGRITEAEFNDFKAQTEAQIESMSDALETELDEIDEDLDPVFQEITQDFAALGKEHGAEIKDLVAKAEQGGIEKSDVSLHLAADYLSTTFDGVDKVLDKMPPHVHDVLDVLETESLDAAHTLLDARAELSSAEEHNLEHEREQLDEIQPTFEAEMDDAHEAVDEAFAEMEHAIDGVQDIADTAQEHAERDPETTVEHMPYQITDDYDAIDEMEQQTGAQV